MSPAYSDGPKQHTCSSTELDLTAAKLAVYKPERLAYTEIPARDTEPTQAIAARSGHWFKTIFYWVMARG